MATTSDGNIVLPKGIKARISEGERLFAAQGEEPQAIQVPLPVQAPQVTTAETPEPQQEEHLPQAEVSTPEVREPVQTQAASDTEVERLTQALRTLQGKYNTETQDLRRQLQGREQRVDHLTQQVGDLTIQMLQLQQGAHNNPLTHGGDPDTLSDEELRDVGPDLVSVIERRARAMAKTIVSAEVADLRKQVASLGGSVETLDTRHKLTERERFHIYMNTNCPGWEIQDNDPLFLQWLEGVDPFSGSARKYGLKAAVDSGDFPRVASIFKGYATERQTVTPTPRAGDTPTPPARVKLDTLTAPNGGRGRTEAIAADPNAPEAPLTQRDIQQFYAKLAHPRHGMTDAEIATMEARIMRDMRSGRIAVQSRV
jgi:hypothetical protein